MRLVFILAFSMSLIFTGADVIPHISHSSPVVRLCCIFPFKSGKSTCLSIGEKNKMFHNTTKKAVV